MNEPTCATCHYYEAYEHEDRGLCTWQKYHRLPKWIGTNNCMAVVMNNDDRHCETINNPTAPMLEALLYNLASMTEENREKNQRLDNLIKSARSLINCYDHPIL